MAESLLGCFIAPFSYLHVNTQIPGPHREGWNLILLDFTTNLVLELVEFIFFVLRLLVHKISDPSDNTPVSESTLSGVGELPDLPLTSILLLHHILAAI